MILIEKEVMREKKIVDSQFPLNQVNGQKAVKTEDTRKTLIQIINNNGRNRP